MSNFSNTLHLCAHTFYFVYFNNLSIFSFTNVYLIYKTLHIFNLDILMSLDICIYPNQYHNSLILIESVIFFVHSYQLIFIP